MYKKMLIFLSLCLPCVCSMASNEYKSEPKIKPVSREASAQPHWTETCFVGICLVFQPANYVNLEMSGEQLNEKMDRELAQAQKAAQKAANAFGVTLSDFKYNKIQR